LVQVQEIAPVFQPHYVWGEVGRISFNKTL